MIRIAIPDIPAYAPLIANKEAVENQYNAQIRITTEQECSDLLFANRVDCALVSPLGYGNGVTNANYRIIPTSCCIAEGFTQLASLYFNGGLGTINTCSSPTPQDFLIQAGLIVLSEQFDIKPQCSQGTENIEQELQNNDAVIAWNSVQTSLTPAMDVSEEWTLAEDHGLPLALWVCREEVANEHPFKEITSALAQTELPAEVAFMDENDVTREGKIHWRWNAQAEPALMFCLNMLFYHQVLPEIPAIKILERD